MPNSVPHINIPAEVWINVYELSGIEVGTSVSIYNIGVSAVNIAISENMPDNTNIGFPLFVGTVGSYVGIEPNETGLWAYVHGSIGTKLSVQP